MKKTLICTVAMLTCLMSINMSAVDMRCPAYSKQRAVTGIALGSGALLTLYYIYATTPSNPPSVEEESLRAAIDIVENEWNVAIDRMLEVNALIDDAKSSIRTGDQKQAALCYWTAAAVAREIADIYQKSVITLFNLPYIEEQTLGNVHGFKTFILQACTLSCTTYDLSAQLYEAAGDPNSSKRVLNAKECIHQYMGLHENNSLNAQELKLALSMELKRLLIELGNTPQETPRGLTLDTALVNKIEKFDIETHMAAHESAIRVFDEL